MRKNVFTLSILFASLHAPATANPFFSKLVNCENELSSVVNIIEPFEGSTRTYANGNIRIIHLDTGGEPACCSSYLAILAPDPADNLLGRQCLLLTGDADGSGFMSIDFNEIRSRYDQQRGLLLSVPVERYIDGVSTTGSTVNVRINQTTGMIAIE